MSTLPSILYSTDSSSALASTPASTRSRRVTPGPEAANDTPRQHKLRQAAQQFESMLMSDLWKSMKSSFDDDEDSDPAIGTLQDWSMEAMSTAIGKAGGLGIAKLIMKDLEPKIGSSNSQEGGTHPLKFSVPHADIWVERQAISGSD